MGFKMNSSVWRDIRGQSGGRSRSRDVIVGLRDGNRIWRVSPDNYPFHYIATTCTMAVNYHYISEVQKKLS